MKNKEELKLKHRGYLRNKNRNLLIPIPSLLIDVVTNQKYFRCYYCDDLQTDLDVVYQRHIEENHPEKPVYPTKRQIQELGLKPQNKVWEELGIE